MVERSVSFARAAMDGRLLAGDPDSRWRGAAIDSRRIAGREIFFALPGERTDGHRFAAAAAARGASAVVVHEDLEPAPGAAWLRVGDTFRALHRLTRAVRSEVPRKLVAITGSTGKTTTKELLAAMLARRFRVAKNPGNLNNLYGFPLSLLNIPDDSEWMVAEMGMSTPGELAEISRLGRPDVALFTNVRPAHLENFADLRGIAEAKAELLAGLAADGVIVANADDPEVMHIVERAWAGAGRPGAARPGAARIVLYGFRQPAEVRGSELAPRDGSAGRVGSRFRLTAGGESRRVELAVHGLYNAENCLAAAACAHTLGVPLDDVVAAAAAFEPSPMRGVVRRLSTGATVVDDSYNSNPDAAVKALESARRLPAERYLAILGDMLELGEGAAAFHRQVGRRAAALGFEVVGVGELARTLVEAARRGGATAEWLADAGAAAAWARDELTSGLGAGDLVLVKGSRGVGLEAVVETLGSDDPEGGRD